MIAIIFSAGLRVREITKVKIKDIRTIQELMGHKSIKTTMIYLNLAKPVSKRVKSPL